MSKTSPEDDGMTIEQALQVGNRIDFSPEVEPSEEESVLERMQALLAEAPTVNVKVKVYKLPKIGSGRGTYQWCEDFDPESFTQLDWNEIRARWGAGTYQMRLIGPRGVVKAQTIEIANQTFVGQMQAQTQQSELSQVLTALAENQAKMLEALTNRPKETDSLKDTLSLMVAMREAMGINAQPAASQNNPMEMMREVFSMVREAKSAAKELADEEAPPSNDPMAMLPKLLDVVGASLKTQNAQPVAPVEIPPSFAQANPTPPRVSPNQETDSPDLTSAETPEQAMIMIHVNAIFAMAKKKLPIETAGEYIAANLPDDLMQYLDDPNMFENIKRFFPAAAEHEEWIKSAIAHAKTLLEEEPDEAGSE